MKNTFPLMIIDLLRYGQLIISIQTRKKHGLYINNPTNGALRSMRSERRDHFFLSWVFSNKTPPRKFRSRFDRFFFILLFREPSAVQLSWMSAVSEQDSRIRKDALDGSMYLSLCSSYSEHINVEKLLTSFLQQYSV
jgi:hypothetical protein